MNPQLKKRIVNCDRDCVGAAMLFSLAAGRARALMPIRLSHI